MDVPPNELPALSSLQCAAALVDLGYALDRVLPERLILVREGRTVVVPRHRTLSPDELRTILFLARVEEPELLTVLARRELVASPPGDERPGASSGVRSRPAELADIIARLDADRRR